MRGREMLGHLAKGPGQVADLIHRIRLGKSLLPIAMTYGQSRFRELLHRSDNAAGKPDKCQGTANQANQQNQSDLGQKGVTLGQHLFVGHRQEYHPLPFRKTCIIKKPGSLAMLTFPKPAAYLHYIIKTDGVQIMVARQLRQ